MNLNNFVSYVQFFFFLALPLSVFEQPEILYTSSLSWPPFIKLNICILCIFLSNGIFRLSLRPQGTSLSGNDLEWKKYVHNEIYLWWNVFAFSVNLCVLVQNKSLYGPDWLFDERWPEIPCPPLALLLIYMELAHYLVGFLEILVLPKQVRTFFSLLTLSRAFFFTDTFFSGT